MRRRALIDDVVRRVSVDASSVLLVGTAGVGKSHLAHTVVERLEQSGRAVTRIAAGAAQQVLPFGAILHLLEAGTPVVETSLEIAQRLRAAMRPVSRTEPRIVLIDDVNLLDAQSAALIENALVHDDIVLLCTERTEVADSPQRHALSDTLDSRASATQVEPLERGDLDELILEWFGAGEHMSQRRLAQLSGGNPLLLRELVATAKAEGAWSERYGLWYLTDLALSGRSLRRFVRQHLDRLGEPAWTLVQTLAAAGPLDRSLVARLDEEPLDGLVRDGILEGNPLWFGHPLYGEVIERSLDGGERRRLLAKLVNVVGPGDDIDDARMGQWLIDVGESIDAGLARRAAELAEYRRQHDLARRLLESIEEPTANDLTQLHLALVNNGELDAALSVIERAIAAAEDEDQQAGAGLALGDLLCLQLGRREDGLAQMSALRDQLTDPVQVLRVDSVLAIYAHVCGNAPLATLCRERVVDQSERTEVSDSIRLNVAMSAGMIPAFRGQGDSARQVLVDGEALAERLTDWSRVQRFRLVQAMADVKSGRLDDASLASAAALEAAARVGPGPTSGAWLTVAGEVARQRGLIVEAERYFWEAIRANEFSDELAVMESSRAELGSLLAEVGRIPEAEALIVELGADHLGDLRGEGMRARGLVRLAAPDEADAFAAGMVEIMVSAGHGLFAPHIAHEAARRGAAPRSAAVLEELSATIEGPFVHLFADHARGVVDAEPERLAPVAAQLRDIGAVLSALDVEADLIDLLKRTDQGREAALQLIASKALLATLPRGELLPVAQRFDAQSSGDDVLTQRQEEIAALAATGLSSSEIGAELFLSARTVDNHLASVYRKLGVSGRAELAVLLGVDGR